MSATLTQTSRLAAFGVALLASVATPTSARAGDIPLPSLRLASGPNFILHPAGATVAAFELSFGIEASVKNAFKLNRPRPVFVPAIGYAFDGPVEATAHSFLAGFGVGVAYKLLNVQYRPQYRVGAQEGLRVHGFRHTVKFALPLGLLGVEVGHDFRYAGGESRHGVVLLFSTDHLLVAVAATLAPVFGWKRLRGRSR